LTLHARSSVARPGCEPVKSPPFGVLIVVSTSPAAAQNRAMEPDRSAQVVARVVAWHNRHPLAQRIAPADVHSVGVVTLPFAAAGAVVEVLPPPETPVAAPAPETGPTASPPEPAAAVAAAPEASEATTAPESHASTPPADAAAPDETPAASADAAEPGPSPTAAQPSAVTPEPATPPRPQLRISGLPPRPPRWHPRTGWQRWRKRLAWRALFSEDFIEPLAPSRVARWALQHGSTDWPLDPQAQERLVKIDPSLRSTAAADPLVPLHLLTAAIAVGDKRLRVLLAPRAGGPVLGQREWSRPRLALGVGALASLVLAAGAVLKLIPRDGTVAPELALAASSPPVATSAAHGAGRVVAPKPQVAAVVAASASVSLTAASTPAAIASASTPAVLAAASAPSMTASSAMPLASMPKGEPRVAARPPLEKEDFHAHAAAGKAPAAASASTSVAKAPAAPDAHDESARRGRVELLPLVPRLDAGERALARQQAQAMRGQTGKAGVPSTAHATSSARAPAKAYALVTRPTPSKSESERAAFQLRAVALLQPVPMRAELMRSGALWRAAFWPFRTPADAEKVRMALSDKGLKTELVEF